MPIAEIIAFLVQAEPAIQKVVLEIIQMIKDNHAGNLTAEAASSAAAQALAQLLGRQADPAAQDAADLAAVTAEMSQKSGGK